jgi:hypothetical protein
MARSNVVDDGQRGLENRLGSPAGQENRAVGGQIAEPRGPRDKILSAPTSIVLAPSKSINDVALDKWGHDADDALLQREGSKAPPGWKISGVEKHFDVESATDSQNLVASEVGVSATVTYEKIDKSADRSRFNYSWTRVSYSLDELIQPEQVAQQPTRRPVVSRAMLDDMTRRQDSETIMTLSSMAEKQGKGEDTALEEGHLQQITNERKNLTARRLDIATTNEDFAKVAEEIAKIQSVDFGPSDPEVDRLSRSLGEKYATQKKWIPEAAKARPDSAVAQKRLQDERSTLQLLGQDESPEVSTTRTPTAEERVSIERQARAIAEHEAGRRKGELVSVTVSIEDPGLDAGGLLSNGWIVSMIATYRVVNERGLPCMEIEKSVHRSELLQFM